MPPGPERDALMRMAREEGGREWDRYVRGMTPLRRAELLHGIAEEQAALARGEQVANPLAYNNGRKI